MNCKSSYTEISCRQCGSETPESQEHLEVFTGYERRGLDMSTKVGQLAFWRRMSVIDIFTFWTLFPLSGFFGHIFMF